MEERTVKRMVLTKEERPIRKSWGRYWAIMKREEKRSGSFNLLYGDWSGYYSRQYRITHVDYIFPKAAKELKLKTVLFTDNTTMNVWVEQMTIRKLLAKKLSKRLGYESLLYKAMTSGKENFNVGKDI